jgi:hypothetical protein
MFACPEVKEAKHVSSNEILPLGSFGGAAKSPLD